MKPILIVATCAVLAGCGSINTWNAAMLANGESNYAATVKNLKDVDDMKLKLWADGACAVNVGALQRVSSTTNNLNLVNAILMACPVPNVGVTAILPSGNMTVQTTNVTPAAPASMAPTK